MTPDARLEFLVTVRRSALCGTRSDEMSGMCTRCSEIGQDGPLSGPRIDARRVAGVNGGRLARCEPHNVSRQGYQNAQCDEHRSHSLPPIEVTVCVRESK
jgi:hypothetical protein